MFSDTTTPPLIGLIGKARSGKDTAAKLLGPAWTRVAHADQVKGLALRINPVVEIDGGGFTLRAPLWDVISEMGWDVAKAHFEVRRFLQGVGVGVRDVVGDDVWVNLAHHRIAAARRGGSPVVVTDVRFQNEAEAVWDAGGRIIRIERPGAGLTGDAGAHISETELDGIDADATVTNDGDLHQLAHHIHSAVREVYDR